MIAFLIRRSWQAAVVLLTVSLLSFLMLRYLGDPVSNLLGPEATVADRAEARERLGLDQPVAVQFVRFIGRALVGDFGISYREREPVAALIGQKLPATLELAVASTLLALCGGIAFGLVAAVRRRRWYSRAIIVTLLVGASLPTFLLGIALIHLFAVEWRILPSFGRGEVVQIGWWSTGLLTDLGRRSLILPSITLAVFMMALVTRLVQVGMSETLRSDHVRFARARGLPARAIYLRHALRNALVPVIVALGLQVGVIISFSIVTETVFRWPGLGLFFINAVRFADVPVIAAYVLLAALLFVTVNLITDLICAKIDPRLRQSLIHATPRDAVA